MVDASKLSDDEWNRLQDLTEQFERDCADAFPRDPAAYIPERGDPLRDLVLDEILKIDLELHWRNGKGNRVEEYLDKFPELRRREGRMLQLIEEEYRVRGQFGDRPDADEFISRFPDYKGVLTSRLRPHSTGEFHTMNSTVSIPLASAGNLTKIRRIGEGGFGEVWECRAPGGVPVAVKRLFATVSPKLIEREKQSLDLICSGKFRHPFLLQVFGWWVQNNQIHIVMELADESLDDRLRQAKSEGRLGLPADETLQQVIRDAGEALDFLNLKCRILHRDVKPANMLVMGGRLKLCDFGLAKMTMSISPLDGKTLGAGTPVFIAPEIVQGHQSIQSDQYSLAVTYCMLRTGRPLFRGTVKEIRDQHVRAQPHLEETILSPGEQAALLKALSKEPTDRFKSSTEFVQTLLANLGSTVIQSSIPVESVLASSTLVLADQTAPGSSTSSAGRSSGGGEPRRHFTRRSEAPKTTVPEKPSVPTYAWIAVIAVIFALGLLVGRFIL